MSSNKPNFLGSIKGLQQVAPEKLAEFKKTMSEESIPEIVSNVEDRRMLAAESRRWLLKS